IRDAHDAAEARVVNGERAVERRRKSEEAETAKKKVVEAFDKAADNDAFAEASEDWKKWREKWRGEIGNDDYNAHDGQIQTARDAAGTRIALIKNQKVQACSAEVDELAAAFARVKARNDLRQPKESWQKWQGRWAAQIDGKVYQGFDQRIRTSHDDAERRVAIAESSEAAKKIADAFARVPDRAGLAVADDVYTAWQNTWRLKLAAAAYAGLDEEIREARTAAARRIADAEAAERAAALKKACEESATKLKGDFQSATDEAGLAAAEKALQAWRDEWRPQKVDGYAGLDEEVQACRNTADARVSCKTAAAKLGDVFGKANGREELEKADAAYRDWQKRWKDLSGEAWYAEADGGIAEARADAAARVEKAELARKVAACREAAAVVARAFGSVATRQELDKADAARREWQEKWKDLAGESGYKEADGGIAGARTNAERRLAEIERKRKGILKVYGAAMKDEPVASRRKRLEDVKGMLEASRKEKLFAEEETGRRLAEIEARLAWTAGEIVNRTGGPLSIGGTNVAAGATATVVFKEGASWTVTRHGYDPVTVNRETLDGKKVTLADDAFTPSDVLVKPPQGLDAGVVCELDGKDVPVSGKAVKPGQYTCAYRRAGYDRREGLRFTVKIGETDARFPNPGAWVASPVEVAVPKLPDDVACKMTLDGEVRKVDGTLKLRPGREYSCVYMRAGYYEQKKPFELSVGVNSVLPAPTEWTPLPVKVTVPPDLPPDVSCEVAGTAYRTGEVFELTPKGQPYEYAYRKTDYEDQPRRLIVEVNQPLTLPSPEDWLPTAGLRNLLDAEKAVNDRDWDGAEGFLKNADVRGQDNKKRKTRLETQVANSKMWGRTLDEIDNLIQNKSDESAGRDSIYTLEKYQQIVKLEYRLSGDDEKKIREMYQSGKEDLERKSSSERMGKSAKEYLKKLEGLFEELLPGEKP
ncbi:MAG: hypothetical protein J6336_10325, partial [Kiritimatiellae bacterium]|nr:hypothetical protein [Kiritimatiellia bacterium]